ncbi:BclA C-terminal domain-containing protein [Bacillus cereus group sp. Bce026]|uniref:BclA C-terminal domain-containing protein n=1 Tax=Bacillus cereus group sp. Bce026 TaxID=3445242 RepID=UPI003F289F2C
MDRFLKSKGCGCCGKFLPARAPEVNTIEFLPAYRNFWQNEFVTIPNGQDIPFNNQSVAEAGGVVLLSPTTVFIPLAGDYEIGYVITSVVFQTTSQEQQVTAILNGTPVPGFQTTFGTITETGEACDQFSGTAILRIPAKSTFSLRNTSLFGSSISLCDLVESGAALIIKKLS